MRGDYHGTGRLRYNWGMTIAIVEPLGVPSDQLEAAVRPFREAGHEVKTWSDRPSGDAALSERMRGAEIAVVSNIPVTRAVVEACPDLRYLSIAFTGVDHVDLVACRERGITVSNSAGYPVESVAEHTIALALAVLRRVVEGDAATRSGGDSRGLAGYEINGRTVGIIGTGAIGRRTAQLFAAFGARVLGYNRSQAPEMVAMGMQYLELDALLAASDIVTVHLPLTDETRGLISAERIARMKPGAILINVARGPVVDGGALAAALTEGRLGGAGIDVFETEPPIATDHPLVSSPRTVLAPHVAYATHESFTRRIGIMGENIQGWLDGAPVRVVLARA